MKNEKFCSQLSTYFKRQVGLKQEDFQTVLTDETEIAQGNVQDRLKFDKEVPGFQLLTQEEIAAVIFFIFISTTYITKISVCFLILLPFRAIFCFMNADCPLILMIFFSQIIPD
jgi:hypothetical protein